MTTANISLEEGGGREGGNEGGRNGGREAGVGVGDNWQGLKRGAAHKQMRSTFGNAPGPTFRYMRQL